MQRHHRQHTPYQQQPQYHHQQQQQQQQQWQPAVGAPVAQPQYQYGIPHSQQSLPTGPPLPNNVALPPHYVGQHPPPELAAQPSHHPQWTIPYVDTTTMTPHTNAISQQQQQQQQQYYQYNVMGTNEPDASIIHESNQSWGPLADAAMSVQQVQVATTHAPFSLPPERVVQSQKGTWPPPPIIRRDDQQGPRRIDQYRQPPPEAMMAESVPVRFEEDPTQPRPSVALSQTQVLTMMQQSAQQNDMYVQYLLQHESNNITIPVQGQRAVVMPRHLKTAAKSQYLVETDPWDDNKAAASTGQESTHALEHDGHRPRCNYSR